MAVSAQATGTTTPVVGTENFIQNVAVAGTFTLHVDLSPMLAGDTLELRIYQMVLTGGTPRVAYLGSYFGAPSADNAIAVSVPISNELTDAQSLRFSILQRLGTARAYPWKILKYA